MVLTVLFTFKFKLRIYDRDGRRNGVLAVTAFERDQAATTVCRDCHFEAEVVTLSEQLVTSLTLQI